MAKLIIHVGPGKCGSSTIQQLFSAHQQPCVEKTHFAQLSAVTIHKIDSVTPEPASLKSVEDLLANYLKSDHVLILSQEYLFETPKAVSLICQLAASLTSDIIVIGYCRRQSNFLISQYSQWLFRSPQRTKEASEIIRQNNLDIQLFTGLERQLIAAIYNDFHSARMLGGYQVIDWHKSYQRLAKTIDHKSIKINCGVLPNKHSNHTLTQDFCDKAGLTLKLELTKASTPISNPSFSIDLVEAINNSVLHQHKMPNPHRQNQLLEQLSSLLPISEHLSPQFIKQLACYIDGAHLKSNLLLCEQFNLDKEYFRVDSSIGKTEIIKIIHKESSRRKNDKSLIIDHYRSLSANLISLCLTLSEKSR